MAAHRPSHFGHEDWEQRWLSFVISLGVTAASFALAFEAMRSVPVLASSDRRTSSDPTVVVRLPVPTIPRRVVVPPSRAPDPRTAEVSRTPARRAPEAQVSPVAPQIAPPIASPIGPTSAVRDSGSASANPAIDSPARASPPAGGSGKGAPIAPSGVTFYGRAANTPYVRDSILKESMAEVPGLGATRAPTGRERQELEQSQRQASLLRRRSLTAGNSNDLVALQGRGIGGVGAVAGSPGVISFGLPLFSSGPSAAQRKKNEKIDADYQLRLRRLQDRMYLNQDSLRGDSLRAKKGNPLPSVVEIALRGR